MPSGCWTAAAQPKSGLFTRLHADGFGGRFLQVAAAQQQNAVRMRTRPPGRELSQFPSPGVRPLPFSRGGEADGCNPHMGGKECLLRAAALTWRYPCFMVDMLTWSKTAPWSVGSPFCCRNAWRLNLNTPARFARFRCPNSRAQRCASTSTISKIRIRVSAEASREAKAALRRAMETGCRTLSR